MKQLVKQLLELLPSNKWSNVVLLIVAVALAAVVTFTTSCCSIVTRTTFSTDSAFVKNLNYDKNDSINFYPLKK